MTPLGSDAHPPHLRRVYSYSIHLSRLKFLSFSTSRTSRHCAYMATDGQPGAGVVSPSHNTRQSPTPNDPPTSSAPNDPPRVPTPVRPSILQPFFLHDDAFETSADAPEEAPKFLPIVPGHVASSFTFGGCFISPFSSCCSLVPFWLQVQVGGGLWSAPGGAAGLRPSGGAFGSASIGWRNRGPSWPGLCSFSGNGGLRSHSDCLPF